MRHFFNISVFLALLTFACPSSAQENFSPGATVQEIFNGALYKSLKWRNIGPFRGGRSVAVAGVPNNPQLYFMGSTGGGLWKTNDAGLSWENISDNYFPQWLRRRHCYSSIRSQYHFCRYGRTRCPWSYDQPW